MPKTITVDFYVVRVSGGDSFQQAMNTLSLLPENETRNLDFQDAPVRLARMIANNQNWEGDLMRIRLNEAAVLASLNGHVEPISVDETRGLGENTAFSYDHALNVIAVQRNKAAVNASRVAHYFYTKGGLQNAVIFDPLFRAETYEKLTTMREVKKFRMKFAKPANLANVTAPVPTLGAAARLAQDFDSPTVEVVLSMGRRKGTLSKIPIIAAVTELLRGHDADHHTVQTIEVSGRYDDGKTDPLDLLEERLHSKIAIEVCSDPAEFYRRRQCALREAFGERRTEIESLVLND